MGTGIPGSYIPQYGSNVNKAYNITPYKKFMTCSALKFDQAICSTQNSASTFNPALKQEI
jgi:hypothetical protein